MKTTLKHPDCPECELAAARAHEYLSDRKMVETVTWGINAVEGVPRHSATIERVATVPEDPMRKDS